MKIILLLTLFFLTLLSCTKTPLRKVYIYLGKHEDVALIELSNFTDFKWDEVWLISGSIGGGYIKLMNTLGIKTEKVESKFNKNFGISKDYSNIIIYIHNKKVVYYEFPIIPDEGYFNFLPKQYSIMDFHIERNQIIVLKYHHSLCIWNRSELEPVNPFNIYYVDSYGNIFD